MRNFNKSFTGEQWRSRLGNKLMSLFELDIRVMTSQSLRISQVVHSFDMPDKRRQTDGR